jgi:Tfp pilus assembly protein PilF
MRGPDAAAAAWPQVTAALALDDQLADAYVTRAILLNDFDWDWNRADADYRKALALDPNNSPAHHWYARHLAQLGRSAEALQEISAAEIQDPLAPMVRVSAAKIHFLANQDDQAITSARKAIDLEQSFSPAYSLLAQVLNRRGRFAEGVDAAKKFVELSGGSGFAQLELAYAFAVSGNRAECDRIVREVTASGRPFSPYDMATICCATNDVPAALGWLTRAVDERSVDVIWLRVDPRLQEIRADPRFAEVLAKMNSHSGTP